MPLQLCSVGCDGPQRYGGSSRPSNILFPGVGGGGYGCSSGGRWLRGSGTVEAAATVAARSSSSDAARHSAKFLNGGSFSASMAQLASVQCSSRSRPLYVGGTNRLGGSSASNNGSCGSNLLNSSHYYGICGGSFHAAGGRRGSCSVGSCNGVLPPPSHSHQIAKQLEQQQHQLLLQANGEKSVACSSTYAGSNSHSHHSHGKHDKGSGCDISSYSHLLPEKLHDWVEVIKHPLSHNMQGTRIAVSNLHVGECPGVPENASSFAMKRTGTLKWQPLLCAEEEEDASIATAAPAVSVSCSDFLESGICGEAFAVQQAAVKSDGSTLPACSVASHAVGTTQEESARATKACFTAVPRKTSERKMKTGGFPYAVAAASAKSRSSSRHGNRGAAVEVATSSRDEAVEEKKCVSIKALEQKTKKRSCGTALGGFKKNASAPNLRRRSSQVLLTGSRENPATHKIIQSDKWAVVVNMDTVQSSLSEAESTSINNSGGESDVSVAAAVAAVAAAAKMVSPPSYGSTLCSLSGRESDSSGSPRKHPAENDLIYEGPLKQYEDEPVQIIASGADLPLAFAAAPAAAAVATSSAGAAVAATGGSAGMSRKNFSWHKLRQKLKL